MKDMCGDDRVTGIHACTPPLTLVHGEIDVYILDCSARDMRLSF